MQSPTDFVIGHTLEDEEVEDRAWLHILEPWVLNLLIQIAK